MSQYVLSQTLTAVRFDQELKQLLPHSDIDVVLKKIAQLFQEQLDRHQELYWKKEYTGVKIQLEFQIQENLGLRHDLREIDDERLQLQKERQSQTKQIDELHAALGEIEEKLNIMSENVIAERGSFEIEQSELLRQLEERDQIILNLEEIVKDLQSSISNQKEGLGKETKELKKQLKVEQELVTSLRQQLQAQKKSIENLGVDKQSVENRAKQFKQQNDALHKQSRQLEIKLIDIQEECERLKKKLLQEQSNCKQELLEKEKQYKRQVKQQKRQVGEIMKKLKLGFQKIVSNIKLELDALKLYCSREFQISQFQQLIVRQINRFSEDVQQSHSQQVDELRQQLQNHYKETLEKKVQAEREKAEICQKENQDYFDELTKQLEDLIRINQELEKELQLYQDQSTKQEEHIEQKQSIIEQQQLQIQELCEQSAMKVNECMELQLKIKDLLSVNEKLRNDCRANFEDKQLKKQFDDLQSSNQYLRKQYQILQEAQLEKEKQLKIFKKQLTQVSLNTLEDVEERHNLRMQNLRRF